MIDEKWNSASDARGQVRVAMVRSNRSLLTNTLTILARRFLQSFILITREVAETELHMNPTPHVTIQLTEPLYPPDP
jgi:hypothetical protein